ncbi:hypothetical protein V8G54_005377 [Vigna mungo]|uniref:Uncharacterized protein n=1 Tax=Vigna mungo TaxID=3915 RepID=A0AAQ3NZ39_VIGMU
MALQPKLVACGNNWAMVSMVARFVVGPAVIAVTAIAIGMRGVLLRIAIIQGYIWNDDFVAHFTIILRHTWNQLTPCLDATQEENKSKYIYGKSLSPFFVLINFT